MATKKYRFRLRTDAPHEEDGKLYKKGQIIETHRNLIDMFGRDKFVRVGSHQDQADLEEARAASGADEDEDFEDNLEDFPQIHGHSKGSPANVALEEDDDEDSTQKLKDAAANEKGVERDKSGNPVDSGPVADKKVPKPGDRKRAVKSELGEDVTKDFPTAKDADLIVLAKGEGKKRRFAVADKDTPSEAVEGGKEFKKESEVREFLKTFAGGSEKVE